MDLALLLSRSLLLTCNNGLSDNTRIAFTGSISARNWYINPLLHVGRKITR